jgi:hypothetical protein
MAVAEFPLKGDTTGPGAPTNESDKIADQRFIDQLREVHNLKRFFFEERVGFEPTQLASIDLGPLNNLRFGYKGRAASLNEWKLLDEKISILASFLTDELRQKIRVRDLSIYFGLIPLLFLLASLAALFYRFLYGAFFPKDTLLFNASYLASLIFWTVAQGGLGACAFLGTRVATKRLEKTPLDILADSMEITDKSILKIRIILGCLFSSLIGIPIASFSLDKIGDALYPPQGGATLNPSDFALMILPFMVGFSTNLVLAILERAVEAIRTLFGIGEKRAQA